MRADRLIINVLIITDIRGLFNSYTQHFVILRKTHTPKELARRAYGKPRRLSARSPLLR